MPSTRSQPLNPRLGGLVAVPADLPPEARAAAPRPVPAARPAQVVQMVEARRNAEDEERAEAARAGGFHESSYELRSGLEINESEWPQDTTIPGALADR
jgi:hypothetical protein